MNKIQDMPLSLVDTKTTVLGCRMFIDELIPNCQRCFVIRGNHERTKEPGYFAFCKKMGKIDDVGPYSSYHEAMKKLVLVKGCDSCDFNKSKVKAAYIPYLTEKLEEELRAKYGNESPSLVINPVNTFVQARKYLDTNFESKFGFKLFTCVTDDPVGAVNLIKPCKSEEDFSLKIQTLAGLIDRLNVSELRLKIKVKDATKIQGSVKVLEQFLKENLPIYPPTIISNLRNLMTLRSKMYPAHVTSSEIIVVLGNFGINKYPLNDWEEGVTKIINLCSNSLDSLCSAISEKK